MKCLNENETVFYRFKKWENLMQIETGDKYFWGDNLTIYLRNLGKKAIIPFRSFYVTTRDIH